MSQKDPKKSRKEILAANFRRSVEKSADFSKKRRFDKDKENAFKKMCACFGVNYAHVCSMFRDEQDPIAEIKHSYSGCGIECVFFYDNSSLGRISDIFKEGFVTSGLWKFLIEKYQEVQTPIVIFKVKNNGLWVISLYRSKDPKILQPKVIFPTSAGFKDPYLYPLESFIKENMEE